MTLREEGYQEANGGPGLNLDVAPYFASSVRTAIGADIKAKITVWNFDLTPEARLGYRYDLLQQAVKIKAAFKSTGGRGTAGNTMTFVGPDPDSGNAILGLSLGASHRHLAVGRELRLDSRQQRLHDAGRHHDGARAVFNAVFSTAECVARAHVLKHAARDAPAHGQKSSRVRVSAVRCYQLPVLGIEAQGSLGSRWPSCSSSMEMPSGERMKAMWPSRGGRLMVTPAAISFSHSA